MPYVAHLLTALMVTDPEEAKRTILAAYKDEGAHAGNAATSLGVSRVTFERWVVRLGIRDEIEKILKTAKKQGWWKGNGGGRPKLAKARPKKKSKAA